MAFLHIFADLGKRYIAFMKARSTKKNSTHFFRRSCGDKHSKLYRKQ